MYFMIILFPGRIRRRLHSRLQVNIKTVSIINLGFLELNLSLIPVYFVDRAHRATDTEQPQQGLRGSDTLASDLDGYVTKDVTVVSGDKLFHASKLLLSARSRVFAAMLGSDMEEARLNRIEIEDASSPETVRLFLRFVRKKPLMTNT